MTTYQFRPEDVEPLLEGLAIYGTGGGGSPEWGREILKHDFARGRTPRIVDLAEISDDSTVVSGGIMGSVKVLEAMGTAKVMEHWDQRFELLEVTRVMEGLLGRSIDFVVPFEVGGLNTPVILSLAARMGISVLDGDALGRSAPETQMTSFIGHGISLTPMPLIDFEGNVVIVQESADPTFADRVGRWIVTHGGGLGANNHYPMSGAQAKRAVIPGTISGSLRLGQAVMAARQAGEDPVETVANDVGGARLYRGEIIALREQESMGFYFTQAELHGRAGFDGQKAELVIKNETMMLSIDGRPKAYFPDLILLLEPGTGRGLMSVELNVGMEVALIGAACHPRLRKAAQSEIGQIAFSPQRYGQSESAYQPIESLVPELA